MSDTSSATTAVERTCPDPPPYQAPTPHETAVKMELEALYEEGFKADPPNLVACVLLDSELLTLASNCRLVEKAAGILEVSERDSVRTAIMCGKHRQEVTTFAKKIFEGHDFGTSADIDESIDWLIKHDDLFEKQADLYQWLAKRHSFMTTGRFDDNLGFLPDTSQAAKEAAADIVDELCASAQRARAGGPSLPKSMYEKQDKKTYLLDTLSQRGSMACRKSQKAFQELYPAFDRATACRWSILHKFASLGQSIDEAAKGLNVEDELDRTKFLKAHLQSFDPLVRDKWDSAPTTVLNQSHNILTSKGNHQPCDPTSLAAVERQDLMNAIVTTPEPFMSFQGYEEWLDTIETKCTEAAKGREMSMKCDSDVESVKQDAA